MGWVYTLAMPIPGKLEVLIKFDQLPTEVTKDKNGWSHFTLDCGPGKHVRVGIRPKAFTKLEQAHQAGTPWVAALGGKIGAPTQDGFVLTDPSLQVFEKKPKVPAAEPSASDATPT